MKMGLCMCVLVMFLCFKLIVSRFDTMPCIEVFIPYLYNYIRNARHTQYNNNNVLCICIKTSLAQRLYLIMAIYYYRLGRKIASNVLCIIL